MRMVKHRREEFWLFDYAGVERHLEKMAAKGWQLTGIEMNIWTYERKAPAKVRYSVTYIPTASVFDPVQTESKSEMDAFCETAGWRKVGDWAQMQIYCTEDPDAVELETDESVRFSVIRKSMRKTFLISNLLMLLVFGLQGCSQGVSYRANPVRFLAQNQNLVLMAVIVFGFSFTLISLLYYLSWLLLSRKSIQNGGSCAKVRFYRPFSIISLIIVIILAVLYVITANSENMSVLLIVSILGMFMIMYFVHKTSAILRKKGVDSFLNIAATLAIDVVLVTAFFLLFGWSTRNLIQKEEKAAEIYMIGDEEWQVHHDEIPVKVEDLIAVDYEHYSYLTFWETESPLLGAGQYLQSSFPDGEDAPGIYYDVVQVKADFLYDMCLEQYLTPYDSYMKYDDRGGYEKIEVPENETIDKLYRMTYNGVYGNEWIICGEDVIVWVHADWEMDEEQLEAFLLKVSY